MKGIKAKLSKWAANKRFLNWKTIMNVLLIILVLISCISIYMRENMQDKYSRAIASMQEQTYQGLVRMTELFARVDEPGVDVANKLIPGMKAEYSAVSALNSALRDNFGQRKAVLSKGQIEAFDAAFDEYSKAFSQGTGSGLAKDDMAACIEEVQEMIDKRYKVKAEETPAVPIIGATAAPERMH